MRAVHEVNQFVPVLNYLPRHVGICRSGGVTPRIPNLGNRCKTVLSVIPWLLYSRGSRSGCCAEDKNLFPLAGNKLRFPGRPAGSPLSLLSNPTSPCTGFVSYKPLRPRQCRMPTYKRTALDKGQLRKCHSAYMGRTGTCITDTRADPCLRVGLLNEKLLRLKVA
jgi:hypothetical protein